MDQDEVSVISASDDRYLNHFDEVGLSKVRVPRMPKLKAANGSMYMKANNNKTRINTVSGHQKINVY